MKSILSRITALALILCLLCPGALAESAAPIPEITARYMFIRHGMIQALSYEGLAYQRTEDGWLPAGQLYDSVWAVDSDGENLWLIVRQEDMNGSWYELRRAVFDGQGTLTGTEAICEIDWPVNGDDWPPFYGLVVDEDTAYTAVMNEDWSGRDLYRVDLGSGKASLMLSDTLSKITRYKDGLLLAQRSTWYREDGDRMPEILLIDPADGRAEVIGKMSGGTDDTGLTYDPETDAIYFSNTSYVYRLDGDAPETVGYLAMRGANADNAPALVHQGRYFVQSYSGLSSSALDPELLPKRILRLHRGASAIENLVVAFAQTHPDIAVEYVSGDYHSLENFSRVMQGENAADVFLPDLDENFITLRDRKYLVDLSSSQVLMDTVGRMAPNVTRDILVDGKLYALPYALYVSMNSYYPQGLEKAGLTAEDVPASYEGMLDFIERWYNDYAEDNEGMQIFEWCNDLRRFLFDQIYSAQLLACQQDGQLTLDTPTFRRLLSRLEELTPIINEIAPPMSDEEFYNDFSDNALFSDMAENLIREYPIDEAYDTRPMPLALDGASDPLLNSFLYMIALNPYSQNTETAIEFMEYVAENLPLRVKIELMPEETGPLERANYEGELKDMRDRLATMETLLADAPEERRADLEDEINYLQYYIKDYEENRWAMTTEEILWYKENIAPYLVFTTVSVYSDSTAEQLSHLRQRYLDGQASADEFINRYEEIIWMKQQEQ